MRAQDRSSLKETDMTSLIRRWFLAAAALAVLSVGSCISKAPLDGRACPCATGFVCCPGKNVCERDQASCGGGAGAGGAGGGGVGGTAGVGGRGGGGTGGVSPLACPRTVDFSNGAATATTLALGPHNHVFQNPTIDPGPIKNYADQSIFPDGALSMIANFPILEGATSPIDSSGNARESWLGELSLVPAGCTPATLAGLTVRVRVHWRLGGAIGWVPPHGIYLGTYSPSGAPVAYGDASLNYDMVTDSGTRTLNELNPIELTHTFTGTETSAYLRMYLADSFEFPTTVFVESVVWTASSGTGGAGGIGGRGGTGGSGGIGGIGGTGDIGGSDGIGGIGGQGGLGGDDWCHPGVKGGQTGSLGGQTGTAGEGAFLALSGRSGTDDAGAPACSCPSGLAIEVNGDGAPLSLTSANVSSLNQSGPASACLASAPPWAQDTSGQVYELRMIEACAGPGAQGPCLLLRLDDFSCSFNSTYIDRAGNAFKGNAAVITNWSSQTPLTGMVEGDYSIRLKDGRLLTGHLRVCLIDRIMWA
jgi:hypothetical protein